MSADPIATAETILERLAAEAHGQRVVGTNRVRADVRSLQACIRVAGRRLESLELEVRALTREGDS